MFTREYGLILRVSIMLLFTNLVRAEESVEKRLAGIETKKEPKLAAVLRNIGFI